MTNATTEDKRTELLKKRYEKEKIAMQVDFDNEQILLNFRSYDLMVNYCITRTEGGFHLWGWTLFEKEKRFYHSLELAIKNAGFQNYCRLVEKEGV